MEDNLNTDGKERQDELVARFVAELYHKGYRKKFTLSFPGSLEHERTGTLKECLHEYLGIHGSANLKSTAFELGTFVNYVTDSNHIYCAFKMTFDEDKGVRVGEMTITSAALNDKKHYRFSNNHQIPGALGLPGLFPKPKPWDNFLKGKFRL